MIKIVLLLSGIFASHLAGAKDYDLASIQKEISATDASYQKALEKRDLGLHRASKERAEKLVQQLEKITGGSLIHPASQCRAAAIYLQTARNLQWITSNSKYATATEKRIDEANLNDFKEKLRLCNESIGK